VAGEIVEGKRTLIERDGQEFELSPGHSARLTVGLSTPSEGSSFGIRRLEIRDDAVVLHLREKAGDHGLGSFGNVSSEIHGYPFSSD
jgi:hypothetical protein